jgi:two-component system, LuxR family, sensor kinase FixL
VQELTGIGMMLHVLERQMMKPSPEFASEAGRLGLMMEKAQENARNLAKSFYPVELEQHGLFVALETIAHRTREQFGVSCVVQADEHSTTRLHGAGAVQLFRIAQEAVQNAAKHAQAKNIIIRLGRQGDTWLLSIEDDGVGLPGDAQPSGGMGLRIMQYRARIIQGTLTVRNNDHGGVLVSCSAPAAQLASSGPEEKA